MSEPLTAGRLRTAGERRARRVARLASMRRRWAGFPDERKRLVFVVGCQRSGTSMLLEALETSPRVWVFGEGTNLMMRRQRLRPADHVARVARSWPAPITVCKPLCDSHLTDVLLDQHHNSQAIWIFRHPVDVARSALRKWGEHQLETIQRIRAQRWDELGWRGERIPPATLEVISTAPLASPADGALLHWYLRTSLVLELGLDRDPRVLVLPYERFVGSDDGPAQVASFLGIDLQGAAALGLRAADPGAKPLTDASDETLALTLALYRRLEVVAGALGDR